jgi:hypothetical protein
LVNAIKLAKPNRRGSKKHSMTYRGLLAEKLRRDLFYIPNKKIYFNLFYGINFKKRYRTLFEKTRTHVFLGQYKYLDLYCYIDNTHCWDVKSVFSDYRVVRNISFSVNEAKCRARYIFNICFEKKAETVI